MPTSIAFLRGVNVAGHVSGEPIEPELAPSIAIVSDPAQSVAGPIWVRGGIQVVSEDATPYERRNRATLCRCGASKNKPFCDANHASIGFIDEQDSTGTNA